MGSGHTMKMDNVALVGPGVSWIWEQYEVMAYLFECAWLSRRDHCRSLISIKALGSVCEIR